MNWTDSVYLGKNVLSRDSSPHSSSLDSPLHLCSCLVSDFLFSVSLTPLTKSFIFLALALILNRYSQVVWAKKLMQPRGSKISAKPQAFPDYWRVPVIDSPFLPIWRPVSGIIPHRRRQVVYYHGILNKKRHYLLVIRRCLTKQRGKSSVIKTKKLGELKI